MKSKDMDIIKPQQKNFHFDNIYMDNPQIYEPIILYQVGDLSCKSGYEIGNHTQFCYEISLIVSGEGDYFSNDRKYRVKKGDIYLSLPGEIHQGIADGVDPFRYFYIGFNFMEKQNELPVFSNIMRMFAKVSCPIVTDKFNIHACFTGIFNELINVKEHSNIIIRTYLYQIIVLTYRNFFDAIEKHYMPQSNADKTKKIAYDIVNFIDYNISKIVDLSIIAEKFGYNYAYLSRIFSHETGLSIQEYFSRKRFEKASELLKNTELNITQIAENLNYQSIHSFSRAFRKNYGISPTQYQALYKK